MKSTSKTSLLPPISIYNQPDCILPKSFFEGRFIPPFHPDSLDYEQWWKEQIRRCEEGWKDGGFSVTGVNYYHLNLKKINMLDIKTERQLIEHPYFSYEDQELFNDIADARKAKEAIALVTARGWGKSFNISSLIEHEFTFSPVSEVIVSSSIDKYASLLWEKIEMGLNSQPSEIKRSLIADLSDLKQCGYDYKDDITGRFISTDDQSYIRKVVYDSDPEKTRGTRPAIHVWEEVGSWSGAASLLDCFKKTEASWWRGSFKTTFGVFIGTGGAMDTGGSIDAKLMFENPEDYGIRAYRYEEKKIGKFYPAFVKFSGYYEKSGKSDMEGAKTFLDARREKKKGNPDLFRQESSEFPYTPEEAFQTSGAGVFPINILEQQYVRIERTPALKALVQKGNLNFVKSGMKVTGVEWEQDENGVFEIVEHPEWTRKDWTRGKIHNLYVSGCDSFDAVAEDLKKMKIRDANRKSRGSIFMFKRFYNAATTGRMFVAKLTQRTDDASEFYWNTLKLNMYYHSKMLVEYTKVGIIPHYITNGFEHLLYERPRLDSTIVQESQSTNRYGVGMPSQVKRHIIARLSHYVKEPVSIDQIYFQSLLRDMMRFTYEGRDKNEHDETMAAAIAILADDDMYKLVVKEQEKSSYSFPTYTRDRYGNLVFK